MANVDFVASSLRGLSLTTPYCKALRLITVELSRYVISGNKDIDGNESLRNTREIIDVLLRSTTLGFARFVKNTE